MNIVKTGFFILLKNYKSRSTFINFYFSSYKNDFYIFISVRPLKVGFIRLNVLKRETSKSNLHKPKDYQRSEVSKRVNIKNNGFKDSNSWKSTKRELYMPEDRPYKPVESQKVTIRPEQASINGLDPETSRGTVRKRLYIPAAPRDVEETDDTRRNSKGYNILLQLVSFWYIRLGYLSLNLFKKTVKIINGIPNLNVVKEEDFVYLAYC